MSHSEHIARPCGFTLLELLVVCCLISILLVVSVPAFRTTFLSDSLKQSVRLLDKSIREARQRAAGSSDGCIVEFDISDNLILIFCNRRSDTRTENNNEYEGGQELPERRTIRLPPGTRFHSIWSGREEAISAGRLRLWISPEGYMQRTIINIDDGHRQMALVTSVFLDDLLIENGVLSPEDIQDDRVK